MSKLLALLLIIGMNFGTGYLVGSNDGKAFREQFIDLSFTCIIEQTNNPEYHGEH